MANRKYRDTVTNALNIFEENGEKVRKKKLDKISVLLILCYFVGNFTSD
jgi:hypothetical protein